MLQTPKMKLKYFVFIAFGIIAFSSFWMFKPFRESHFEKEKVAKSKRSIFCESLVINKFSWAKIPCVDIEIEGKSYEVEFDLGFNGYVSLLSELSQQISDKLLLDERTHSGFRGVVHLKKAYRIPKLKIGKMTFSPFLLEEEDEAMQQENMIMLKDENAPSCVSGKLGWKVFKEISLFLDLGHSSIIVCDSKETFIKKGYSLDKFVKIPLYLDRNFLEIDAKTLNRQLRCCLDTGCTYNILNMPSDKSMNEMITTKMDFPIFQFGGKNFGAITFRPVPINLPVYLEAILGMEFLLDHSVFIDFRNHQIYISVNSALPQSA